MKNEIILYQSVGYRVKSKQGVFFDESTLTHLAKKNKLVKVLLLTKTINKQ